jgi:glycosyltransferase involved in cell wall biosynthesis
VLGQRAVFAIAGEGPVGTRVRQALPFARMLGFLDRDSLAALYASSDLCVLPSRTETCGLVALEAMASGVPVIAADAGGLRESVRDGVNGRLVPPDDPRGYLDAVVDLVVHGDERRALGAGARGFAVGRDAGTEDAELLAQYHALTSTGAVEAPCAA